AFLQVAEVELCEVLGALQTLRDTRRAVMDYFCEDECAFRLEEMCSVFSTFCAKFLSAVQDNREREKAENRRERLEKRRSIASCSTHDKDLQDVELEFLMLRLPRRGRPTRTPRPLPRNPASSPPAGVPQSTSNPAALTEEPITEEEPTPVPTPDPQQGHGLRRPRLGNKGGEGQQETPSKMNRRHTLTCLPYRMEGIRGARPDMMSSPAGHCMDPTPHVGGSEVSPSSAPCTPNTAPLGQSARFWLLDSSLKDTPSSPPASPT
ncbi:hypothetical protein FKM82_019476, partial [Ascaphus truei]